MHTMQAYLKETPIINFSHPKVKTLATELSKGCTTDEQIAKHCYVYVRDTIHHAGDYKDEITTCIASDVLTHCSGWCYAKSHLFVALLRANGIPAGFSYQRLSCSEYLPDIYCLHGLANVYLNDYGWYRVDVRGNKKGVDAQFTPPHEQLAFTLGENEFDLPEILADPLPEIVTALETYKGYSEFIQHFPDIEKQV